MFHIYSFLQIVQCREILYTLGNLAEQEEPPTVKPDQWKKMCASVLALKVSES